MISTTRSGVPAGPRLLAGILFFLTTTGCLHPQEPARPSSSTLQELIADEVRQIRSDTDKHQSDNHLGSLWAKLAANYRKAGDFAASENAYFKALALLDHGSDARRNYGTTLDNLAMLYLSYERVDEAEKYLKRALEVRKEVGIPLDQARTEQHMSEIDLAHHKFKDAERRANNALQTMIEQNDPNQLDIITALNSLTYSHCRSGRCEQGAMDAQRSLDTAQTWFGGDSVEASCALMAMGFADWKLGRMEAADETMRRAIQIMKAHFRPDSKTMLLAMGQYRDYLRSVHRDPEADGIERELIAARSGQPVCANCVNVHTLSNTLR